MCNICGATKAQAIARISGYDNYKHVIYSCECGTHFTDSKPSKELYEAIYSNADKIGGYNRYSYYFNSVRQKKHHLKWLASKEPAYWAVREYLKDKNPNRILEVGCVLGYLTYSLRAEGYNSTGIDICQDAVNKAVQQFGNYYRVSDIFEHTQSRYDLIILTEVIEHVLNPRQFIERLLQLLTPGGALLITTENKTAGLPDLYWDTDLPPVHLYWPTERAFNELAKQLNCTISFTDFTGYNVTHFDKQRLKSYKGYKRTPVFSGNELIKPEPHKEVNRLKRWLQWAANIALLPYSRHGLDKCGTMAFVMKKE